MIRPLSLLCGSLLAGLVGIAALATATGCSDGNPTGATAVPAPGTAPARPTALEGLPLVSALAKQAHPAAVLVEVNGYPSIDGRLGAEEGSNWFYLFMDADGVLYQWRVYADGRVEDGGVNPSRPHLWPYRDIAPVLRVDTDEIAIIGLANGGREFAATFPGTVMPAVVNPPLGRPNWVIQFEDLAAGPASTGCFVGLEVDPATGAVLKTWRSNAANCTMARN